MVKSRYLAFKDNGACQILEGPYDGPYQYVERPPPQPGILKPMDMPELDTMFTRKILQRQRFQSPNGQAVIFLPSEWTTEETENWLHHRTAAIIRIAEALTDPHQVDRARAMGWHASGTP